MFDLDGIMSIWHAAMNPSAPLWQFFQSLGHDWAEVIITMVGGTIALGQYRRNSRRTKAIKAAEEMDLFLNDAAVQAAMHIIDWSGAHVVLRDQDGTLLPVTVTSQTLLLALRHHEVPRQGVEEYDAKQDTFVAQAGSNASFLFSPEERALRATFDTFLGRLERIESLIRSKVISPSDFYDYFSYWLSLMGEIEPSEGEPRHFSGKKRRALWEYIRRYRYFGTIRLFRRYNRVTRTTTQLTQRGLFFHFTK